MIPVTLGAQRSRDGSVVPMNNSDSGPRWSVSAALQEELQGPSSATSAGRSRRRGSTGSCGGASRPTTTSCRAIVASTVDGAEARHVPAVADAMVRESPGTRPSGALTRVACRPSPPSNPTPKGGAGGDHRQRSSHRGVALPCASAVEEKIGRLSGYLEGMDRAEVHFTEERNPRIAAKEVCEVTLEGHGHHVRCKVAAADGFAAIDAAVDKLEHQLHKLKTKVSGAATAAAATGRTAGRARRRVRAVPRSSTRSRGRRAPTPGPASSRPRSTPSSR